VSHGIQIEEVEVSDARRQCAVEVVVREAQALDVGAGGVATDSIPRAWATVSGVEPTGGCIREIDSRCGWWLVRSMSRVSWVTPISQTYAYYRNTQALDHTRR